MWLQVEKVVVREWFEALVEKVFADCSRFQLRESARALDIKGVLSFVVCLHIKARYFSTFCPLL